MPPYRIWVKQPEAAEWVLLGQTIKNPTAAVARAIAERVGSFSTTAGQTVLDELWEDPPGTIVAGWTVTTSLNASQMTELPPAPQVRDLDAP
jgi:hypothetical protein